MARSLLAGGAVLVVGIAASAPVSAEPPHPKADRRVCVAAAERGQELRDAKRFRDARAQFLLCARDDCPSIVADECKRWRSEAEAAIASVLLEVTGKDGHRVTAAKITIDGSPWSDEVSNEPIELDPGSHEIRVEQPGAPPVVRTVSLAMGERDHVIRAGFAEAPPVGNSAAIPEKHVTPKITRRLPVLPIVLGAAGVAAAGTGVAFWLLGNADLDDARRRCAAAACADSETEGARTKHLVGDVLVGASVVAIGAAVFLLLTRDKGPPPALAVPVRGGAVAGLRASF